MTWLFLLRLCPVLLYSVALGAQAGSPVIDAEEYSCFTAQEFSQWERDLADVPPTVNSVLFDQESHTLAFSVRDERWSRLIVFDSSTGTLRWSKQFNAPITSIDIAKGGNTIAAAFSYRLCRRPHVEMWDSKGNSQMHFSNDGAYAVAFSPDGTQLGIALRDYIQVWDIVLKRKVFNVDAPVPFDNASRSYPVSDLSFNSKRRQIIGCWYKSLYIWDLSSGHRIGKIRVASEENDSVSFAMLNDQGTIAAVGTNYKLYVVDLNSGKIINSLIGLAPISFTEGGKSLILNNLTIWRHFKTVEPVPWFIQTQPTFYKAVGDKVFGIYLDDEAWQKDPHVDLNGRFMGFTPSWQLCTFKIPGRPSHAPPLQAATK